MICPLLYWKDPGCVCLRHTEPNQTDPFLQQQLVMLLAPALSRGERGGYHTTGAHYSPHTGPGTLKVTCSRHLIP